MLNMRMVFVASVAWVVIVAGCSSHDDTNAKSDGDAAVATDAGAGHASARIYVTLAGKNEVLVLDDDSHKVVSHIPVGKGPAILLSTPDYEKLYTANWSSNDVSVISVASEKVATIKLPGRPYVIAMAPAGDYVYAGLNSNQIAVIDTANDKVERFLATKVLPASVIVSADGKTLYVATLGGELSAVSADDGKQIGATLTVGSAPAWITSTPDGAKVYTLNFLSDSISVVDTASWTLDTTIDTGAGSQGIIGNVTPDGTLLYVTNHGTGDMIAIDTMTNKVTQTIKLTGRPVGVNFDAAGKRVYVADFGPESLKMPADTSFLLTGSFSTTSDGQLSVYDVKTGKQLGTTVTTGPGPTSIVVLPKR